MTTVRPVIVTALAVALHMAIPPAVGAQDAAKIKRGAEVFAAQKCSVCHAIAGKGGKSSPLDGVVAKLSADDIRNWIVSPDEMTAKTKSTRKPPMPA
jgi:mono/diheme cytochrome c family protein